MVRVITVASQKGGVGKTAIPAMMSAFTILMGMKIGRMSVRKTGSNKLRPKMRKAPLPIVRKNFASPARSSNACWFSSRGVVELDKNPNLGLGHYKQMLSSDLCCVVKKGVVEERWRFRV